MGRWLPVVLLASAGCLQAGVFDLSPEAMEQAESVVWTWQEPSQGCHARDVSDTESATTLPEETRRVEAWIYRCPVSALGLLPGTHPWTNGCLPITERIVGLEVSAFLAEPPARATFPLCSPCDRFPTRLVYTLAIPDGFISTAGVFVAPGRVLLSTWSEDLDLNRIFVLDLEERTFTAVDPNAPGLVPGLGPFLWDGDRLLAVTQDRVQVLTLEASARLSLSPLTEALPLDYNPPASQLLIDGGFLYWATGYGGLARTDWPPTSGAGLRWTPIVPNWTLPEVPHVGEVALRASLSPTPGGLMIGVGIAAQDTDYQQEGPQRFILPTYATISPTGVVDRLTLPGNDLPAFTLNHQGQVYVVARNGRSYPVLADGRVGPPDEGAAGAGTLKFGLSVEGRLVLAGAHGSLVVAFPGAGSRCVPLEASYGDVLLASGTTLLHGSGNYLAVYDVTPIRECGLPALAP